MLEKQTKYVGELVEKLKQDRDELRVKLHLASKDVKEEWEVLDRKFLELKDNYKPAREAAGESSKQVWEALKLVGEELRDGYRKIRRSL